MSLATEAGKEMNEHLAPPVRPGLQRKSTPTWYSIRYEDPTVRPHSRSRSRSRSRLERIPTKSTIKSMSSATNEEPPRKSSIKYEEPPRKSSIKYEEPPIRPSMARLPTTTSIRFADVSAKPPVRPLIARLPTEPLTTLATNPNEPQLPLFQLISTKLDNPDSMSPTRKYTIAGLIVMANFIPMNSFGAGIGGGITIGKALGVDDPSEASWIPASYTLTMGAFVIMTGRMGTIYGHSKILLLGAMWWCVWTLINAFCNNFILFNVARALSGIGGAMIMPNALAILGITFPPGRTRNLCLGLYGAGAPVGGWSGTLLAGLLAQLTPWKYLFIFMALLGAVVFGSLYMVLPKENPMCKGEPMDWFGGFLAMGGLILFNFVWNQAPTAGWSNPYEIALLIVSIFFFIAFFFWERKFSHPILPGSIWKAPSFFPLILVVLLSFMSYGTFIWYLVAWQQNIRHWSVLSLSAGMFPLAIAAAFAAWLAAFLVRKIAAQWIMALGAVAILIAQIILATMPEQQIYWAQVFPATTIQSFCPDFIFTAASIIACNSVRRSEQGFAGSLVATTQVYATSIGLGFAGIVEVHTNHGGADPVRGYRSALYFGIGIAVVALLLSVFWVRMPKDTREGWGEGDLIETSPSESQTSTGRSSSEISDEKEKSELNMV